MLDMLWIAADMKEILWSHAFTVFFPNLPVVFFSHGVTWTGCIGLPHNLQPVGPLGLQPGQLRDGRHVVAHEDR